MPNHLFKSLIYDCYLSYFIYLNLWFMILFCDQLINAFSGDMLPAMLSLPLLNIFY